MHSMYLWCFSADEWLFRWVFQPVVDGFHRLSGLGGLFLSAVMLSGAGIAQLFFAMATGWEHAFVVPIGGCVLAAVCAVMALIDLYGEWQERGLPRYAYRQHYELRRRNRLPLRLLVLAMSPLFLIRWEEPGAVPLTCFAFFLACALYFRRCKRPDAPPKSF